MSIHNKTLGAIALIAGCVASSGAVAALVTITESADSSQFTLSGCDFNTFTINATSSACGTGQGGSVTMDEPGQVFFGGNWLNGSGGASLVLRSLYWVASPGSTTITHVLNISASSSTLPGFPGSFSAGFGSGGTFGSLPANVSPNDVFVEGTFASFAFERLTINITTFAAPSDPAHVPEPSALALFGLGLAGVGLGKRRKA